MHPQPKYPSVLGALRKALASGKVYMSDHALGQVEDRLVPFGLGVADVISVLRRGTYEEEKDEWNGDLQSWAYSIRGKTMDRIELRIPIAIETDEGGVVVVSVVNLSFEG